MARHPIRHIAFDLDGTLIDADALHKVALNAALLAACGRDATISEEEHTAIYKGLPTRVKLRMLVDVGRVLLGAVDEVARLKQEKTLDAIWATVKPDSDKTALLRLLWAEGWKICVCSNAVRESVAAMLQAAGLEWYLDFYLSNQDAPAKPDPGMYVEASRRFMHGDTGNCIPTTELVVVEDAAPGKEAALKAGCILVPVDGPDEVSPALLPRIYKAAGRSWPETKGEGGTE